MRKPERGGAIIQMSEGHSSTHFVAIRIEVSTDSVKDLWCETAELEGETLCPGASDPTRRNLCVRGKKSVRGNLLIGGLVQ